MISFDAACPSCGRDCQWTQTEANRGDAPARVSIDCDGCGPVDVLEDAA